MIRRKALAALAALLATSALLSACDGGDEPGDGSQAGPTAPGDFFGDGGVRTSDPETNPPLTLVYPVGTGDLVSDQPGLAVGDFNADGADDVLIGARFADGAEDRPDSGAAYIVLGSGSPPQSVDLASGEQQLTLAGAAAGDGLGFSATAADLNDDGIDDAVVGAPFASGPSARARGAGAAYAVFGRSDLPGEIDLAADPVDVTFAGTRGDSFFGDSLAAGDINGDGVSDLIVGSTFDASPREGAERGGAVYVFLGRADWPEVLTAADSDIAFYGADEFDELGDFVASGDLNGDGFDDVLATAEAADGPGDDRQTAAEVHVLFGGPDVSGAFEIADGDGDLAVYGAVSRDTLGFSLASGDLDGDGFHELVMGARLASAVEGGSDRAGRVYVLYGGEDLPDEIDLADPAHGLAVITGAANSDLLGNSGAAADLDGDGRDELLLGAGQADGPAGPDSGALYVMPGPAAGGEAIEAGAAPAVIIFGATAGDRLGANVASGDFDGDGTPDLVIVAEAAPGPDEGRPETGRVYVIEP